MHLSGVRYSIVIPVYNGADYIHDCLQSLLMESARDFEVILVDDGSLDASREICGHFAATDERVRLLTVHHGGVSRARNVGIEAARGTWLTFVDADDMLERNWHKVLEGGADSGGDYVIFSRHLTRQDFLDREDCYKAILGMPHPQLERIFLGRAVSKLFLRARCLEQSIRFVPGMAAGEDMLFNLAYALHADRIAAVNDGYYHFRRRVATGREMDMAICDNNCALHDTLEELIKQNGEMSGEWRWMLDYVRLNGVYSCLYQLAGSGREIVPAPIRKEMMRVVMDDPHTRAALQRSHLYTREMPTARRIPVELLAQNRIDLAWAYVGIMKRAKQFRHRKNDLFACM